MKNIYLLIIIIFAASCRNDPSEVNRIFGQPVEPHEIAKNLVIEYRDSTRLKVIIQAAKLERKRISNQDINVFDEGVFVKFYDNRNRVESWLESDWAQQNDKTKEVIARDNVVLYNIQGDTLITSEMIWDEANEEVHTTKFVKIKRPNNEVLYSYGFRADQNFTNFTVNAVEGDLEFEELDTDI